MQQAVIKTAIMFIINWTIFPSDSAPCILRKFISQYYSNKIIQIILTYQRLESDNMIVLQEFAINYVLQDFSLCVTVVIVIVSSFFNDFTFEYVNY